MRLDDAEMDFPVAAFQEGIVKLYAHGCIGKEEVRRSG
jgi:hypothetical protein